MRGLSGASFLALEIQHRIWNKSQDDFYDTSKIVYGSVDKGIELFSCIRHSSDRKADGIAGDNREYRT